MLNNEYLGSLFWIFLEPGGQISGVHVVGSGVNVDIDGFRTKVLYSVGNHDTGKGQANR